MGPIGVQGELVDQCRILMHASPYPVALFDGAAHGLLYGNSAFCVLSGDELTMPLGRSVSDCLPRCPDCVDLLARVTETGIPEQHAGAGLDESWSYSAWQLTPHRQVPSVTLLLITETSELHRRAASVNEALLLSAVQQHESVEVARATAQAMSATVVAKEKQLDRSKDELRSLASRLLQAQDDERRRIARELHDSFSQQLAFVGMQLFRIRDGIAEEHRTLLMDLEEHVGDLSRQVRDLSHQLHPSVLEDLGLAASLYDLVASFESSHGLNARIVLANELPTALPLTVSAALYRIVQESFWNTVKHAGKGALVTVRVSVEPGFLTLSVEDTGMGFDVADARGKGSLGLLSMYERGKLAQGVTSVESSPGMGTTIRVVVPITLP